MSRPTGRHKPNLGAVGDLWDWWKVRGLPSAQVIYDESQQLVKDSVEYVEK
jgi:hypothetical protein